MIKTRDRDCEQTYAIEAESVELARELAKEEWFKEQGFEVISVREWPDNDWQWPRPGLPRDQWPKQPTG